jgi:ferredoxin
MSQYIKADRDRCIGAGLCSVAPGHFEIDSTGKVVVLHEHAVDGEDLQLVEDAVALCPAEALSLVDRSEADTRALRA